MKIGSVAYCIVFQYVNISVLVFAVVNGFSYIATLDCYVGPRTESVDWMFFWEAEESLFDLNDQNREKRVRVDEEISDSMESNVT